MPPAGYSSAPENRYGTLRFAAGGMLTPKWASSESALFAALPSGLTVANRTAVDADSLSAAAASSSLGTAFPDTGIGRQLREAAAVLRMRKAFGLSNPVFTAVLSGFLPKQDALNTQKLADLSRALKAFHDATLELNISKQVTTFTDMDYGSDPKGGKSQLVIGGSVRGGNSYTEGARTTLHETYTATLMRWTGGTPKARTNESMGFLE
jgi:hypothetical protein